MAERSTALPLRLQYLWMRGLESHSCQIIDSAPIIATNRAPKLASPARFLTESRQEARGV